MKLHETRISYFKKVTIKPHNLSIGDKLMEKWGKKDWCLHKVVMHDTNKEAQ